MSRVEFDLIARDNASEQFRRAAAAAARTERSMTKFNEAMAKFAREINAWVTKFSAVIMALFRRPIPNPPIPLHGFTPNFDLVCRVCGVGPEECRGGRA